jgi:hypothetical protein
MAESTAREGHNLDLVEKVNSVFLGTRDFKQLAERAVHLMADELKSEGIPGVAIFRVKPEAGALYAYAFATRSFDAVNKLFPRQFSDLSVSLDDKSNLLVGAIRSRQPQESDRLYDFSRPTLSEKTCNIIQRTIRFSRMIAYPLRLKQGKAAGVVLFALEGARLEERQRVLLEAFRSQLELAFENVLEFENVVERYKRSMAKASPKKHTEDVPTVRFTLRITPRQNNAIDTLARKSKTDKATLIRQLIDKASK